MGIRLASRHIALTAAAIYALCLIAALFTELLSTLPGSGISIWLSTGLLLSVALVFPPRTWGWLGAASAAAELTGNVFLYHHDWGPALLFASGNVAAALTGAYCIRSFTRSKGYFRTVHETGIFIIIAAMVMPSISASIGSIALGWSYANAPFAAWPRIFIGDATGAVIAAPFGLLLFRAAGTPISLSFTRRIEAGLLMAAFLGLAVVALGGVIPFAYLMIAPTIWAALRFRIPGAVVAISALTLLTALSTLAMLSPFAGFEIYGGYNHLALQLFLLLIATSALLVGAIAEENRQGWQRLHLANGTLEQRVAERSASLAASEARARTTASLLSAIGEACPDLIYAKNLDQKIIYANSATLVAFGRSAADGILSTDELENMHRIEEANAIQRHDEAVLASEKAVVAEESVTLADGQRRTFRTTKAPMYDGGGKLAGLACVSVDISDLKEAQARERILVREVDHRSRNLLAVVQGIVSMAKADSVTEFKAALAKRIQALARTNRAIAASDWHGADLAQILRDELLPFDDAENPRATLDGEEMSLDPDIAQSLTLVIHELVTNAVKYGALSNRLGHISISWEVGENDGTDRALQLLWRENGGPAVREPSHRGFGSKVIQAVAYDKPGGGVHFDWKQDGLTVRLILPIKSPHVVDHPANDANKMEAKRA